MRMLVGLGLLIAAAAPQPVFAEDGFIDAQTLRDRCKTDATWCRGYITGVVDGTLAYAGYSGGPKIFCVPTGTGVDTIIGIVRTYLDAHPEKLQYDASGQVMLALNEAFPCPK